MKVSEWKLIEVKVNSYIDTTFYEAMIHVIKTGFKDTYIVVWEDAHEMVIGETSILSAKQIFEQFKIKL
jgi:hypothetical protein